MPVLTPQYGMVFLISDLANEVVLRCENRSPDVARTYVWLRDALIEISSNPEYRDDFDNLELWGPVFNLTPGTAEYAFSNFLSSDPNTGLSSLNQATLTTFIWRDPPTNALRQELRYSHYKEADRYASTTLAQPSFCYRFGDNLGFCPTPDQAYQVQCRFLQYHPIADQQIESTQILLPREWNEVLVWAAVERGFMELLEFERAAQVHTLLFGDPRHQDKPGLINSMKKRRKKEMWRRESSLSPRVGSYGYGNS